MSLPNGFAAGLTISLAFTATATAHANEGMWMPSQMSELTKPLREAGFQGDPRKLAEVTQPPLNAVVKVGGGTGAFVSGDGLLLTNHHVAYGVIQYNTSAKENLIESPLQNPANPHEHWFCAVAACCMIPENSRHRC